MLQEINFDGIIGPTHNYAGLSVGNIASTNHAGNSAHPRQAALQGVAKMRHNLSLGLAQGFFIPLPRPNIPWLEKMGTDIASAPAHIRAISLSASSMWTANAATVSPAPDTKDGKCHLTVANLGTMPHRATEWPDTLKQLQTCFSNSDAFTVHEPIPKPFGDEGAANHMRLCHRHNEPGVEIFVYGETGGRFPARQNIEASRAIARLHGLDPDRTLFLKQATQAIDAGAFHNDVVAVANENVLFLHETALADSDKDIQTLKERFPDLEIIVAPADAVPIEDAVQTYLFNAQLVTLSDADNNDRNRQKMGLILPTEARDNKRVWTWLTQMVESDAPIDRLFPVDVRQSMANGGGPACLRLRVVADPATVDQRFMASEESLSRIEKVIAQYWPETTHAEQLKDPAYIDQVVTARRALLTECGLEELG